MARRKKNDDGESTEVVEGVKERFSLSPEQRDVVIKTRIELGDMLKSEGVPSILAGEARKLLGMNNTALYRRLERSWGR